MKVARELIDSERDGIHGTIVPKDAATLIVIDVWLDMSAAASVGTQEKLIALKSGALSSSFRILGRTLKE